MKKFTILILIITISFFRMGIISRADTEIIYYNLQWTNNVSWDLETGVFDSLDYRYSVSNRLEIKDYFDMVWVDNTNFHHLLIFDGANRFIGYYNSVYTNIQTSKYLGVYNTGITLPANAVKFAFMNYTGSNEVEIPQLDDYTLNELFEVVILGNYQKVVNPYEIRSAGTYYTSAGVNRSVEFLYTTAQGRFSASTYGLFYLRIKFDTIYGGHSTIGFSTRTMGGIENYYGAYRTKYAFNIVSVDLPIVAGEYYSGVGNSTNYTNYGVSVNLNSGSVSIRDSRTTISYAVFYDIRLMMNDKVYSTLYQTTFDIMTTTQIKAQLDQWLDNPIAFLGIQLPQAVIDEYKLLYEYNKTQTNYTQTFTPEVYEAVNPFYYRYFDPNEPPREPFSFTTFINKLFNIDGFESSLIQMIISAVIIGGALFVMAMYKASGLLMIIVGVITYTGLAIIGWLPQAPILIMALGLVALIIIKLVKGGGGSDEE